MKLQTKKYISKFLIWAMLFPFVFPSVALAAKVNLQDPNQVQGVLQNANGGLGNASGVAPSVSSVATSDNATYYLCLVDGALSSTPCFYDTGIPVNPSTHTIGGASSVIGNGTTATTQTTGDTSSYVATDNFVASAIAANPNKTTPAHISQITASVASNAVTVSAVSQYLDFRSATLGNGAVSTVLAAPTPLVIPSGATLGCVNAASAATCQVMVLETLPTSGVPELAVVNIAGGDNLDETTLLTTTTISSGATSATGVYATTGRSSLPFRVIGTFVAAETTAGTWATSPSLVQGCGGVACSSLQSIGYGQTWQALTGSRALGTTYYNTTSRPIVANVIINATNNPQVTLTINGVAVSSPTSNSSYMPQNGIMAIIPPGASYVGAVTLGSGTLSTWTELR